MMAYKSDDGKYGVYNFAPCTSAFQNYWKGNRENLLETVQNYGMAKSVFPVFEIGLMSGAFVFLFDEEEL